MTFLWNFKFIFLCVCLYYVIAIVFNDLEHDFIL